MSTTRWIELRLGSSAADDRILAQGMRPLMRTDVAIKRGYFLRTSKTLRLRFELVGDCTADMARRLGGLLAGIGLDSIEIEADDTPQFTELEGLWEGTSAGSLRDDFFSETSAFVLHHLAEIGDRRSVRLQLAFDLMAAHAIAMDEIVSGPSGFDEPRAFLTYRSHADGFFIMSKDPAATKRTFDAYLQNAYPALEMRLGAILRSLSDIRSSYP